jgi:SAM-dependent methyltransferase
MTAAERGGEHERIRAVYAYYESSDAEQRKRDTSILGNQLNVVGKWAALREVITRLNMRAGATILDVGCGSGADLQCIAKEFAHLRLSLHGVDLVPNRIEQARRLLPQATLRVGGAEQLEYEDRSFDLVLACTVFSSILDVSIARSVAREMTRVAGDSAVILCYDMRYLNPWNPHVRAIRPADLRNLFPQSLIRLTSLTLLPPLARIAGPTYRPLHAVRLLRSHYLAEIHPARSPDSR